MPTETILVVEDDPVVLDLVSLNFELEGYEVLRATDGEQALHRVVTDRPDLVVTDILMPTLSGLTLLAAVKGDPEVGETPVLLLSARAQAADVQAGLDAGADDYVTKPFDPDDLLDRVDRLVHHH